MNARGMYPVVDLGSGAPIERIVVPITLDHRFDRGVAVASQLADRWRLPIHLVSVRSATPDSSLDQTLQQLDERERLLRVGWPWLKIDDEAMDSGSDPAAVVAASLHSSDLVVLATESVGNDDWHASFAQALSQQWGGPIVMVGPHARINTTEGDVAIGLDGSALPEQGMPAAIGLSNALESRPWVVQVVPTSLTKHVARLKARGEPVSEDAYLCDVVDRLGEGHATGHLVRSDETVRSLVEFADAHNVAFHVMTTRGESGSAMPRFGSVCMGTVRHAHCPVVVIRPMRATPDQLTA